MNKYTDRRIYPINIKSRIISTLNFINLYIHTHTHTKCARFHLERRPPRAIAHSTFGSIYIFFRRRKKSINSLLRKMYARREFKKKYRIHCYAYIRAHEICAHYVQHICVVYIMKWVQKKNNHDFSGAEFFCFKLFVSCV